MTIEDIFERDLSEVTISNLPVLSTVGCPKPPSTVLVGEAVVEAALEWSCLWGMTYTCGMVKPWNGNQRTPWGLFREVVLITKHDFCNTHAKFYLLGNDLAVPRRVIVGSHNFVVPTLFDISLISSEARVVSYFNRLFNTLLKQCPKSH